MGVIAVVQGGPSLLGKSGRPSIAALFQVQLILLAQVQAAVAAASGQGGEQKGGERNAQ
jgi:hypothetical protein